MAKNTPASAGFKPIEVPVRDETKAPGFKPREVEVRTVTEPAIPVVHPRPKNPADTESETGKSGKKEA